MKKNEKNKIITLILSALLFSTCSTGLLSANDLFTSYSEVNLYSSGLLLLERPYDFLIALNSTSGEYYAQALNETVCFTSKNDGAKVLQDALNALSGQGKIVIGSKINLYSNVYVQLYPNLNLVIQGIGVSQSMLLFHSGNLIIDGIKNQIGTYPILTLNDLTIAAPKNAITTQNMNGKTWKAYWNNLYISSEDPSASFNHFAVDLLNAYGTINQININCIAEGGMRVLYDTYWADFYLNQPTIVMNGMGKKLGDALYLGTLNGTRPTHIVVKEGHYVSSGPNEYNNGIVIQGLTKVHLFNNYIESVANNTYQLLGILNTVDNCHLEIVAGGTTSAMSGTYGNGAIKINIENPSLVRDNTFIFMGKAAVYLTNKGSYNSFIRMYYCNYNIGTPILGTNSNFGQYYYLFNDNGSAVPPNTICAANLALTNVGSESISVRIQMNYADGTTKMWTKTFYSSQNYELTAAEIISIASSGNLIRSIGISAYTTNPMKSDAQVQLQILGAGTGE